MFPDYRSTSQVAENALHLPHIRTHEASDEKPKLGDATEFTSALRAWVKPKSTFVKSVSVLVSPTAPFTTPDSDY